MLFNSYAFIFLFLPVALVGFHWLGRQRGPAYACGWLTLCSFFFYGSWNPVYMGLMFASIVFNYGCGGALSRTTDTQKKLAVLCFGITADLLLLFYFKYANFFISSLNAAAHTSFNLHNIILPLGISFFTFTQIAFLVDVYRGIATEQNFIRYCLFVSYFPHLIAGPVLHHKEMMPQFSQRSNFELDYRLLSVGVTIFVIGLFKKQVVADGIAVYAGPVFNAAATGTSLNFFEAWGGALSYTLQLYFDFSGYSDMAVGLSFMLGIRLPMNFFSPYKSRNIIEFWRRWHMTLSRFLRDYLYIPLGGNRDGEINRYRNLLTTMVLGGLWHGAAWTFVIWGAFHGILLAICHLWKSLVNDYKTYPRLKNIITPFAYTITFLMVVVGWVFFRADSFQSAMIVLKGMAGMSGFYLEPDETRFHNALSLLGLPVEYSVHAARYVEKATLHWIMVCLLLIWVMPNTYQIMNAENPVLDESRLLDESRTTRWQWSASRKWLATTMVLALAAILGLNTVSEFLYFQF
jgi:alginate O-acetyltransferase complex protein AlgI